MCTVILLQSTIYSIWCLWWYGLVAVYVAIVLLLLYVCRLAQAVMCVCVCVLYQSRERDIRLMVVVWSGDGVCVIWQLGSHSFDRRNTYSSMYSHSFVSTGLGSCLTPEARTSVRRGEWWSIL